MVPLTGWRGAFEFHLPAILRLKGRLDLEVLNRTLLTL